MNLRLPLVLALASGVPRRRRDEREREHEPVHSDEYPGPDRRDGHDRREDVLDEAQLRGWAFWAKVMFVHRAKLIAFASALCGALGYLGATLGIQARVARLEQVTSATSERVSNLEDAEPLKFFMLCGLYQQNAAGPTPKACETVLSAPPLNIPMPTRKRTR